MAQIFNRTFDSGTNGALATGAYNNASGLFDYSTAAAVHGGMGVVMRATSSTYGLASYTAVNRSYEQFYMRLPSAPSGTGVVWRARSGSSSAFELRILANGGFDVRNGFTAVGSAGAGLPYDNSPVRFLVRGDASGAAGTHQIEVRAFWGDNLENPDPDAYDSRTLATGLTMAQATWNTTIIGGIDAAAYSMLIGWDSHSADDTTWPAPLGTYTPPVGDPIAYLWDGATSVPITEAYHWDGTASALVDLNVSGGTTEPPPPTGYATVFGANVGSVPPLGGAGQTHKQAVQEHIALMGNPPILRSFLQGIPSTWANTGDDALEGDWENRWSWISMKPGVSALASGSLHQQIVDYVSSIPVTGKKRLLTAHHEPENDGTAISAATYKNAYYQFGQSVQSVGHPDVLVGPIFMARYNLFSSGSGHSANAIITANTGTDLGDVSDFIGWDPYFETSEAGTFRNDLTGAWYFQPLADYVHDTFGPDMPIAFGETGCMNNVAPINGFAVGAYRPWMMLEVERWCLENGNVLACCYFDNTGFDVPWFIRVITDKRGSDGWPGAPYPTDQASIDTWAGVYQRNPLP